jgi:hypothetical protein
VLRGYGAGAVDYLSKPIKADILRSKIAVFVELHRKTIALAGLNAALEKEIAERRNAQEALEQANQELELRVRERTAELTLAHRGLRESVERLRLALEVAEMGAWEWDVQSGRMTWSHDPATLFGFPAGAFGVDQRLFTAVHPDDGRRMEEALASATAAGAYAGEYRIVRPDGSIVWITESGRAIRADDGRVEKMVGVSRDVTAERAAARERERLLASEQRARAIAEQQGRLKDEFLATLSHELRTPMNVVLGWLDILASGAPIRDVNSTIALIRRNAQLQAKLIDELLDMNRLVSGNLRLELGIVDVGATLQGAIQGLKPAADAKNIQLIAAIEAPPVQIAADNQRVQQILWNLLHNAIKFTEAGGRVESSVRRVDRQVHIVVRDTGRGIALDFLPHVFERFRQEDSSPRREFFGLGLGLSISKHLVEAHGGTIEAHSEGHGRGATFTVTLPAGAAVGAGAEPAQAVIEADPARSLSA